MKYIDNRINANIVKLEDENNNYTSENVEGALEEIDSKIKTIEANGYDDTKIKQDINNIKTEMGTEELTTTDQTIKSAVNEIDSQIKTIKKNHIYLSEFDGTVQEAINYCINNKYDLIINKDITITETLEVNNSNGLGCRIVGTKNRPTITINSNNDIPVFYFYSGSGSFSNTGIDNLTFVTTNKHLNTAIKINGVCNGKFSNIKIEGFKYGIHLCNDTGAGTFTELNNFNDISLNDNVNGIRMEKLNGDDSFHGNNFFNVYINVYADQIGFNFVSGYYYNGNFRLYMWALSNNSTYLHIDGNGEHNIGDITYESSPTGSGKITGGGRFWYNGSLQGIGELKNETSIRTNGEKVFACDNYIKPINHEVVGRIASMSPGYSYSGVNAGMFAVENEDERSFLINGYRHGDNSKLFLGETLYGKDLNEFNAGLYLTLNGSIIKTYNEGGLTIKDKDGNSCVNFNNGKVSGRVGNHNTVTISPSSEVQSVTLPGGIDDLEIICLASVIIRGSNYEQRMLYSVNHNGFGNNGSCTKLSDHYTLNADGVNINSITVDTYGNLVINILTDRTLIIVTRYQGIGIL